jgi:hypothetical protein
MESMGGKMKVGDLVRCTVDTGEGVGIVTKLSRWTYTNGIGYDVYVTWANGILGPFWYRADELTKV